LLDSARHTGAAHLQRISEGEAALAAARMLIGAGAVGTHTEQADLMTRVVEAMSDMRGYRAGGTPRAGGMSEPRTDKAGITRREILGTAARWTVPTVVTMTLGARVLEAKASCPPCQKKVGAACRACTISQMLNCSCEPCLGPPYCAAVGPSAPAGVYSAPGSQSLIKTAPGNNSGPQGGLSPYQQMLRDRARAARDPFRQPLYDDPFGARRDPMQNGGLYNRLRPDTTRRQP